MRKKPVMILVVFVMIVSLLAACSTNGNVANNGNENGNTNTNTNQNANADEQTDWDNMEADLVVYGQMFPSEWEDRYEVLLREYFPNYSFSFISAYDEGDKVGMNITELVASGAKPDIYIGGVGSLQERFMPAELHTPMNELMEKHGVDVEAFEAAYFDSASSDDGDIYMLPVSNNGYIMYYNEALFDRFGIDYPTDGMSWEETIAIANEFTRNQDGKQYVGLWYSPKHFLRVNQKSLNFVDPETNEPVLDTDEWTEWISTLFSEPMQNPGLQDRAKEQYFGHDDFRRNDVVGMYVYTSGWIRNHQSELPPNWNMVSVPTFDNDGIGVQPYAEYFGVASTSKSPDAAMRVLKYLTGEEFQKQFSRKGFMTPLKSQEVRDELYADIEGLEDKNVQALFYNELAPQRDITTFDEIVIEGPLHDEILPEIVRGNLDVNQGIRQAMDSARVAIEQELLRLQAGN